jgi:hypothetical protein
MRPLKRTTLPQELEDGSAYGLLIDVFGPYCSFSDEPLPDVAYVWDKADNSEYPSEKSPGGSWNNLLLFSPATRDAWIRHRDQWASNLSVPDSETTFRLESSPFVYALETVEVFYLDESGAQRGAPQQQEFAIVRGSNDQAQATIDMFDLNTEYFNEAEHSLRIPYVDYLSRRDARLHSRTQAWRRATHAAQQIALVGRGDRGPLLAQVQNSAASTGYWSVWATVLWNRFNDVGLLSAVLGARTDIRGEGELLGSGPHNEFPGTAPNWLDLELKAA